MNEPISSEERYLKLKEMITELMEISAPYQNARDELAKTLISLSSAAVVLMITFGKPFAVVTPNWFWRSPPYVSWIAFLVTIAACIITLWFSITVRGIGIRLYNERVNIIRAVANPKQSHAQPYQEADNLIVKVTDPNKKILGRIFASNSALHLSQLRLCLSVQLGGGSLLNFSRSSGITSNAI